LCNTLTNVSPVDNSAINDLTAVNRGCLPGEAVGTWYSLNVAQDGIMAFTITYQGAFAFIFPFPQNNYDFALWGPFGPYEPIVPGAGTIAALPPICPPSIAPIRCSNNTFDWQWNTILGGITATTGLQNNAALPTSGANRFVRHLNVLTGQVYLLYITRTFGGGAYSLSWQNVGPGGAPLPADPLPSFTEGNPMLVCGPLPVELLSFDAKPSDSQVYVEWATASETNSSFFEVQRSSDGTNFLPIGRVQAAGFSNNRIDYGFVDDDPLPGLSYYRLRQVDTDGTWAFSRAVPVRFQSNVNSTGLDLYPNPANESVTLGFDLSNESGVVWRIMDTSGRLVITGNTAGEKGRNRLNVPLTALDPGAYIMDLRDGAGHSLGTARFVKQ
jgi:hypothetical protein